MNSSGMRPKINKPLRFLRTPGVAEKVQRFADRWHYGSALPVSSLKKTRPEDNWERGTRGFLQEREWTIIVAVSAFLNNNHNHIYKYKRRRYRRKMRDKSYQRAGERERAMRAAGEGKRGRASERDRH